MAVFQIYENGRPSMAVVGDIDPDYFHTEAVRAGHPSERLRLLGDSALAGFTTESQPEPSEVPADIMRGGE